MLLSNQLYSDQFFQLIGDSHENIRLVMPSISSDDASQLLKIKRPSAHLELVTGYDLEDFFQQETHFEAIRTLVNNNERVVGIPGLTGSFCLFDNRYALVNSGPITQEGYGASKNYEILVDNPAVINTMLRDYQDIMANAHPRTIDKERIREMELSIEKMTGESRSWTWDYERIQRELQVSGWTWMVLKCVIRIPKKEFVLDDVYGFSAELSKHYPFNNHIKAKIRQQLQVLRDRGLLEFVRRGYYRKLPGLAGL